MNKITVKTHEIMCGDFILLHVHILLGNVLVKKFPQRQILGKKSVARAGNNRESCVFFVRGDVTTMQSDHVTCDFCGFYRRANSLAE
jgi:hypothetical protein